jgi:acetyltransferase-like isoleucine patch superfamily enzyme
MRLLFNTIAKLLSLFYDYRLDTLLNRLLNEIHSRSLRRILNTSGSRLYIERPVIIKGFKYILIGENFTAFARLRLEAYDKHLDTSYTPSLTIGNNVSINYDCHIGCINKIRIGNNVLMASKVFITDHYHGEISKTSLDITPSQRKVISKGPVIIEDNVWIGEGVAILPGVTIGKNSIIGANSVVNKSIPENAVAAGNPAKVLRILK